MSSQTCLTMDRLSLGRCRCTSQARPWWPTAPPSTPSPRPASTGTSTARWLLRNTWWSTRSPPLSSSCTAPRWASGNETGGPKKNSPLTSLPFARIKIEKNLFSKSGDLKIKCTATIDPLYWKSNEESIQGFQERSYINFWNTGNYLLI